MTLRSEEHFLEIVNDTFPNIHRHMLVGRGDDCAVLSCPEKLCLSSDLFLENVHFRLSYFRPQDVGYKALAVNLSDLAANGAIPLGFNLNLIWPAYLDEGFCRAMLKDMAGLAAMHDLALTGGDLSFGSFLGLGITIWGSSPDGHLLRGKCRPGDILFVAGQLGLARCGLELLERASPDADNYPLSINAHLRPVPLVREAAALSSSGKTMGLMDVSDGLSRDLPRFLAQGTGVEIDASLPVHPEVKSYCASLQEDPLFFTLLGGEDYALLGGCLDGDWPIIKAGLDSAWIVGRVVEKEGIFINGKRINLKGFDHFEK